MDMTISYQELSATLRVTREDIDSRLATRLHRAISWLHSAEEHAEDMDLSFISLWIGFNACYGEDNNQDTSLGDRQQFHNFVSKLVRHDQCKGIYRCLWKNFPGPVRLLINNKYIYARFWQSVREGDNNWEALFDKDRRVALRNLANGNIPELLCTVLDRLYILRNQLVHGGATYSSKINRDQVQDGAKIMGELLPVIVQVMLTSSLQRAEIDWGDVHFPAQETA